MPLRHAVLLQVTRADVTRMLRADALEVGLGVLLIAAGIAAALVYARIGRRERTLPWLALFSLLYGVRLLARTDTVPVLFDNLPSAIWPRLASAITYVIPLPGLLFLRATFARWRRSLGWAAAFLGAFAAGGIVADAVLGRADAARTPNNLIAIAFLTGALLLLFRRGLPSSPDLRTLRLGVGAFVSAAVVDNLRGLHVLAWPRSDVEPMGFAVLVACFGWITVRHVFEGAQRLSALDKELSIARQIQASILPRAMPEVEGLHVAARYQPMTAVAGDFYEFLLLGRGRLGVLVADVSGHGVPAALIASMVKVAAAAQRPHADRPDAVLAGVNETLAGQLDGQYVTAAYLFLDRGAELIRYAGAGHPPLLHWRAGAMRPIEQNGFPLGLMPAAEYRTIEQPLRPGDRFLLYTDGLVEATNEAGEFFELERVTEALAAASSLAVPAAADLILERNRAFSGPAASDDLTLVLVDCV
jgi:phosphoserine phosphatase RsbU/P